MSKTLSLEDFNFEIIESTWRNALQIPGVFRYQLNIPKSKRLPGKFRFFIELNRERTEKRRRPQEIESVTPAFNPEGFHFNKVREDEVLFELKVDNEFQVDFLVNSSPLTPNHCLICPNRKDNIPQILNADSLDVSFKILTKLDDRKLRIGFNTPGARASVNHLHLHLMDVEEELFVENCDLIKIGPNLFKLEDTFPTLALILLVQFEDNFQECSKRIMKLLNFFCENQIPYNIFITMGLNEEKKSCFRVFVFPKHPSSFSANKDLTGFNVAFCELDGYVPVGSDEIFESLMDEKQILEEIKNDMGYSDYDDLLKRIINLLYK